MGLHLGLDPINSMVPNAKMHLINEYQKEFQDFTYVPEPLSGKLEGQD